MENAAKGPAHAEISSLPPHQHQGHAAAFAPQIRRNPFFSWVQMLIAGWQGKSLSHSPLLGQGGKEEPSSQSPGSSSAWAKPKPHGHSRRGRRVGNFPQGHWEVGDRLFLDLEP